MTASTRGEPRPAASIRLVADPDPNELVQMNVRVPRWVRDSIDARRKDLTDRSTGRPLSRDKWVANAARYALEAPARTPTVNTQRRTAPRTR